jgi:SAM-dependent methyltransferase
MDAPPPDAFYNELAPDFDLIFADWEASMERQGAAIAALLGRYLDGVPADLRVLDAAAGIGTQSLPLARRGYRVTSRDLSAGAIARLQREAAARGLSIDAAVADMRTVGDSIAEPFDAVLACDNSVPHLLSDDDLRTAFRSFHRALRPGGVCLLSVRDYDQVEQGKDLVQPYGIRWRDGVRYLPLQVWYWVSASHYDITFYLIADEQPAARVRRTTTRYYAVPIARLLALLGEAGFVDCERLDGVFYQPVLVGRRPRRRPFQEPALPSRGKGKSASEMVIEDRR